MDFVKYRAWIYSRQGLDRRRFQTAREALAGAGWQRSVGGVNPYLGIRARSGEGRAQVDQLAADLQLFELPSARGCTYVLPSDHFALGLAVGRNFNASTDVALARKLGVQDFEIDTLKSAIVVALEPGPLTPADLKGKLGDMVRNMGEEGKKKGLATTLPLGLSLLQSEGKIRRKPTNGRLDTQRYAYERWEPPLAGLPGDEETAAEIARLFFSWAGAATFREFREFSAFTARAAQPACGRAGIAAFGDGSDLLSLPGAREEFEAFEVPVEPAYRLVGNMDPFLALRRGAAFWLHEDDAARQAPTESGMRPLSGLAELWSHAILDRGRLVGLWEFDGENGGIVWASWAPESDALRAAVDATDWYIRDELGDARSFSLDSPVSRRSRLDGLRGMGVS